MATTKTFELQGIQDNRSVNRGDIVRKGQELFIVTLVSDGKHENPIHSVLFDSTINTSVDKYNLVSLETGTRYFDEDLPILELKSRLNKRSHHRYSDYVGKFQIVKSLKFIAE